MGGRKDNLISEGGYFLQMTFSYTKYDAEKNNCTFYKSGSSESRESSF